MPKCDKIGRPWFVCQLGAREHYAIPVALQRQGRLAGLVTDAWAAPGSLWGLISPRLSQRFRPELTDARVQAANARTLLFELTAKARGKKDWELICARNRIFQREAVRALGSFAASRRDMDPSPVIFSYSYAAREILRWARAEGWPTVLGQIDPGPAEERIVARLSKGPSDKWKPAPPEYWKEWREECALADCIVVNSEWSKCALEEESIPAEKIRVVPLAIADAESEQPFMRQYPASFSPERPMRVLFLGQVNARKGAGPLLEAAHSLAGQAIEFWFVGPLEADVPEQLRQSPHLRWFGSVPRNAVARFYQGADVFLFPTFSDGFGLTQLEAQRWRLPIIASRFCGSVVRPDVNGLLLAEVTADAIVQALSFCRENASKLQQFAANSQITAKFSLGGLQDGLLAVDEMLHASRSLQSPW